MNRRYARLPAKVVACLLFLACSVTAFWSGLMVLGFWETLWRDIPAFESGIYSNLSWQRTNEVEHLLELYREKEQRGLSYTEQARLEELEAALAPGATNYRYVAHTQSGEVLADNLSGRSLPDAVEATDYTQSWSTDQNGAEIHYIIEWGLEKNLPVADEFRTATQLYNQIRGALPTIAIVFGATALATLILLIYLLLAAGRRPGEEGAFLNWQDRIPLDLYGLIMFFLMLGVVGAISQIDLRWRYLQQPGAAIRPLVALVALTALLSALALASCLTLATRLKARYALRGTVIWRACAWVGGQVVRYVKGLARQPRTVLLFVLYLLGSIVSGATIVLALPYQGLVLYYLCRWTRQWKRVQEGTRHIAGGELEYQIDTAGMMPGLKEHAQQLNDIGSGMARAVEERIKSERFKTELITNVSHDLKTPLTSIINYVDLLKKEEIEHEKAAEYIGVLERKAQRLKRLTEDLVEASKASTGSLPVEWEHIGIGQLLEQALGEYTERFEAASLKVMSFFPKEELYIRADGRHLWRILDNLLGNCVKYTLEGSRIYVEAGLAGGQVVVIIKNISRNPLNVQPDVLMERFVRGDEARTSEGSGLGLSIARSLTELQGGQLHLSTDGDLFKATVAFPRVAPDSLN